ncbi:hypothetical protein ISCGN_023365 [Ixodes scapularis]
MPPGVRCARSTNLGCADPLRTKARRTSVVIPTSWHRRHVTAAATPGPLATLAHGRKERHHRSFLRLLDRTVDASGQFRRRCWALRLQDFPPFGSAQAEPVFAAKVSSSNDCEILRKQHEDYAVRLSVEHFKGRA